MCIVRPSRRKADEGLQVQRPVQAGVQANVCARRTDGYPQRMAVDARAAWVPGCARALVAIALATALSGCASASRAGNGVASRTPARIVALATAAAEGAASVHV